MERAEATGFGVAIVGHVALLAALTYGLTQIGSPPAIPAAMEVSFVDEVGLVSAAPAPAPAPPALGTAPDAGPIEEAAPAPAPEPEPLPPRPAPSAPPRPAQATVARERAAPPLRPAARPTARPTEQRGSGSGQRTSRSVTDPDFLAGIGSDPAARSNRPPATVTGEARASINAAIRRALVPCERQPLPAPEAGAIKVDVRVTLNPNGSLASAEVARVLNGNPALGIYERRMQDLALAIVRRCTPIRGLPAELYDVPRGWRQFTYQFDPRQTR